MFKVYKMWLDIHFQTDSIERKLKEIQSYQFCTITIDLQKWQVDLPFGCPSGACLFGFWLSICKPIVSVCLKTIDLVFKSHNTYDLNLKSENYGCTMHSTFGKRKCLISFCIDRKRKSIVLKVRKLRINDMHSKILTFTTPYRYSNHR